MLLNQIKSGHHIDVMSVFQIALFYWNVSFSLFFDWFSLCLDSFLFISLNTQNRSLCHEVINEAVNEAVNGAVTSSMK